MSALTPLVLRLAHSGVLANEDYPVLADLSIPARREAAETILIAPEQKTKGVHLVVSGFVYRYKILPEGKRQIIGILLPGDLCDLQAAILRRSDHFIATLTDSEIATIPQPVVDKLTLDNSRIARSLWWSTLVDESILRTWLTNMGQRQADKWLAHFFCELLLRLQIVRKAEDNACELPITQDKIADILGITPVHVNRVLRELREGNLADIKGRRLIVPNTAKLWSFCGFEPDYLHLSAGW
jgi:CRP-like cAMP-binding protein